ncbi:MAG: nuclear transport factor 2 family protein [bacterium]|nr:nuclear transport factor 2 family protein [bacterium]
MRKTIFLILLMTVMLFPLTAEEKTDMAKEKAAIKEAALNYLEGWYEGSPERMAKALHPSLHKVGLMTNKKTGNKFFNPVGFTAMVEYARMGFGKKTPKEKRNISVQILDVYKNMAAVKTMTCDFIDFLHLAKINGQWKIKNVLWEPAPPAGKIK